MNPGSTEYFCYVLHSQSYDRYYVGHCKDVKLRVIRHNKKLVASTRNYVPRTLVYYESYETKLTANRRELEIKKKKSRNYIKWVILNGPGTRVGDQK